MIAKTLGLRNGQDAIVEFLKISNKVIGEEATDNLNLESFKYLIDHAKTLSEK